MIDQIFHTAIAITMVMVLIVLGIGIFAMTSSGKFNKKWSQKLMRMRVLIQGIVILLIVLFFGLIKN